MTANQVKLLASVFVLLALWRLFEIPGVATAFWAFCTVGAIPGTDKILGFETMARVLIGLFVVAVLLIFRREFIAAFPRRSQQSAPGAYSTELDESAHQAVAGALAVTEAVAPLPMAKHTRRDAVVVVLSRQVDRTGLARVRPFLQVLLVIAVGLIRLVSAMEWLTRKALTLGFQYVKKYGTMGYGYARKAAVWSYGWLRRGAILTFRLMMTIWKLCEPHFRTFDRYLDDMLHANKYTGETLKFMSDASKAVTDAYQKTQQAARGEARNK